LALLYLLQKISFDKKEYDNSNNFTDKIIDNDEIYKINKENENKLIEKNSSFAKNYVKPISHGFKNSSGKNKYSNGYFKNFFKNHKPEEVDINLENHFLLSISDYKSIYCLPHPFYNCVLVDSVSLPKEEPDSEFKEDMGLRINSSTVVFTDIDNLYGYVNDNLATITISPPIVTVQSTDTYTILNPIVTYYGLIESSELFTSRNIFTFEPNTLTGTSISYDSLEQKYSTVTAKSLQDCNPSSLEYTNTILRMITQTFSDTNEIIPPVFTILRETPVTLTTNLIAVVSSTI
jgi:hypothetical protein